MPDRYGERFESEAETAAMHATAITIGCRYCNADPGHPCINSTLKSNPPTKIPHPIRINDAEETPF
ncbi:MAG: zinc finger domain-containing protein [Candidatus Methylumidiphilus sp.]